MPKNNKIDISKNMIRASMVKMPNKRVTVAKYPNALVVEIRKIGDEPIKAVSTTYRKRQTLTYALSYETAIALYHLLGKSINISDMVNFNLIKEEESGEAKE